VNMDQWLWALCLWKRSFFLLMYTCLPHSLGLYGEVILLRFMGLWKLFEKPATD